MINRGGRMERDFIGMNNKKNKKRRLIKRINNSISVVLWTEGALPVTPGS